MSLFGTLRRTDFAVCSFCGKRSGEVQAMVYGSGVRICDACVDLATEIINETKGDGAVHPRFRRERSLHDQAAGWLTPIGSEDDDGVQFETESAPDLDIDGEDPNRRR